MTTVAQTLIATASTPKTRNTNAVHQPEGSFIADLNEASSTTVTERQSLKRVCECIIRKGAEPPEWHPQGLLVAPQPDWEAVMRPKSNTPSSSDEASIPLACPIPARLAYILRLRKPAEVGYVWSFQVRVLPRLLEGA